MLGHVLLVSHDRAGALVDVMAALEVGEAFEVFQAVGLGAHLDRSCAPPGTGRRTASVCDQPAQIRLGDRRATSARRCRADRSVWL